jgi:tetratricopeptide (TPR) repeat protein
MIFASGSLLFSKGCQLLYKKKVHSDASGNIKQVNFDDYFIDACTQFGNANYTLSIKNLEKCVSIKPDEASVYYQLSKNYNELSNPNLSLQNAMKAYNLAPDNTYYSLWYGEKLSEIGNLNEAVKVLSQTFSKNTKNEQVLKALDALYVRNTNPIQDRIDIWLKYKLSAGYKLNSTLKLIEFYIQIKDFASAHLLYDEIKKASPLKYKYYIDDANLYLQENDEKRAFENFEKARALNPDNFNLNYSLFKLKADKKAIIEANTYLNNAFSDPLTSLDIKLDVCKQINQKINADTSYLVYANAIALCLVKNYPDNPKSLLVAAKYFEQNKQLMDALVCYTKINEISPGMYDAWLGAIKMSSELKQHSNTIDISNKALEYYPNVALIYLEAAKACNAVKEYSKAIEFEKSGLSFAFDPSVKGKLLLEQGISYFKLKQFKDAETTLQEALSLNDKDPNVLDHLGNVFYALNSIDKAIEYWKKAKELGLDSTTIDKKINNGKYIEQ